VIFAAARFCKGTNHMATLNELLDKAVDVGLDIAQDRLTDKPKPPAPVAPLQQSKIPTWLLPVGIVVGIAVVLLMVFRRS